MEVISHKLPKDGIIIDTGDWHYGSINCHKDGIQRMIDRCLELNSKGTNCYMVLKGDLMETIAPDDKRYNIHDRDSRLKTAGDQRKEIIKILKPVARHILALGIGNHELKDQNKVEHGKDICEALDVRYGAYTFVIEYRDTETGRVMFKTFHSHGAGRLRSQAKDKLQREANRKASLKQKLINTLISDCIYMSMGHTHQLLTVDPNYDNETLLTTSQNGVHQHEIPEVNQSAKYIPPDQRWYANTGSFLKLYAPNGSGIVPYGELGMFEPADLGWVEVEFKSGRIVDVVEVAT